MWVKKYINSIFSSNTYLLYKKESENVWLIDPGDSMQIFDWINAKKRKSKGYY